MTISIPQNLEKFISDQVQAGRFTDPQAVVVQALAAMREADIIDASDDVELRRAVHAGIEDLDHGRCEPWDPQAIKTNGRRLMEEHASRKP